MDPGPGFVAPLTLSHTRGFYDDSFTLRIDTATAGARIFYTLDGSRPDPLADTGVEAPVELTVSTTTILRVLATADGLSPTRINTHTYLFLQDVLDQPASIDGYPQPMMDVGYVDGIIQAPLDYEMDPEIVGDEEGRARMVEALRALPSMSIVMDREEMFGPDGVYRNGNYTGRPNSAFEFGGSVEWLDLNEPSHEFQIDSGVRPHAWNTVKRSLRLLFKEEHGATKLRSCIFRDAPLNGDSATNKFDRINLRSGSNRSWATDANPDDTTYTRDQWIRDSQIATTGFGSHGTFVHLYINGLYWGLYNPTERTDAWFTSEYMGGNKEDWFAISHGGPIDGDSTRYDELLDSVMEADLSDPANYQRLTEYLDIPAYADYLLINWFAGTADWPGNNWFAGVQNSPPGPVRFFAWDAEDSWDSEGSSGPFDRPGGRGNDSAWVAPAFRRDSTNSSDIARIWHACRGSDDFMMQFADRAYRAMFNDGPLTAAHSQERWKRLIDHIRPAMWAESARWGDALEPFHGVTRNPPDSFEPEAARVHDVSMAGNVERMISALREESYYPPIDPPVLAQHGGQFAAGFSLTIDNPNGAGQILYTLDGTDPREFGGGTAATAQTYSEGIALTGAAPLIKARVKDGSTWSALCEAQFDEE